MDLLTRLGPRAERRMTPRLNVAIAGAGALIAIGGAIGLGGDNLVDDDGDIHRIPGVIVAVLLIAVGLGVLAVVRTGALALAGSTAVAIGVPVLVFFLTVNDDGIPPFSIDAILGVSALVWFALYVVGPSRGRMVLLAGALAFTPLFVIEEVEDLSGTIEAFTQGFTAGFGGSFESSSDSGSFDENGDFVFPSDDESTFGDTPFAEPHIPDPTTIGLIALGFGLVYLVASHVLTRRGFAGIGTPLAVVGAISSYTGVGSLGGDLRTLGTGIAYIVLGLGLAALGAAGARRFTSWLGAFIVANGVIVIVADTLDDADVSTASLIFLLVGIVVVCFGHLLGVSLHEPAEEDERRSFRAETRQEPGEGPAPDDDAVFAPEGPPIS